MSGRRRWRMAIATSTIVLGCGVDAGGGALDDQANTEAPAEVAGPAAQGSYPSLTNETAGLRAIGGVELFVREFGEGDPLLVIHGGPGMEHSYLVPGLEVLQEDARLVLYDQRGTGRSGGEVVPAEITLDTFLGDIDGVRASIGVESVDVLAHSFGGLLAMLYAARYENRVRSLILVNSSEPGSRFMEETVARQEARLDPAAAAQLDSVTRSEAFARRDSVAMNRVYWLALRRTFADPARADRLRIDFTKRTADNGGPVASFLVGPLGDYDYWDEVEQISTPTLVVHGIEDLVPESVAEALASSVTDGQLALIPDAGHFPFLEQPELFREAVGTFLSRVRAP